MWGRLQPAMNISFRIGGLECRHLILDSPLITKRTGISRVTRS